MNGKEYLTRLGILDIKIDGEALIRPYFGVPDFRLSSIIEDFDAAQWNKYPDVRPTEYGKYVVYRAGCDKIHNEVWNNIGWSSNNNDITHWREQLQKPKL